MKSYKEQIVDSAIQGLKEGGFEHAEMFRILLERVYDSGYAEAIRNTWHQFDYNHKPKGCHICGIESGKVMGYVCNNPKCPVKITC